MPGRAALQIEDAELTALKGRIDTEQLDDAGRLGVEAEVERQLAEPDSMLHFFRRALRLRRARSGVDGATLTRLSAEAGVLTFRTAGGLTCVLNAGERPVDLPAGEVLVASTPLDGGRLPADAAVWVV